MHRAHVSWADQADIHFGQFGHGRRRPALHGKWLVRSVIAQRQAVNQSSGLHARQCANAIENAPEVTDLLCPLRKFAGGNRDRHSYYVTGIEPGIHMVQLPQAANQKTGANQQDQRKRHFRNHQRVARAVSARIRSGAAQALLQRLIQICFSHAQRRQQTCSQSSEQRNPQRERQDRGVQSNFVGSWQPLRQEFHNQDYAVMREYHSQRSSR